MWKQITNKSKWFSQNTSLRSVPQRLKQQFATQSIPILQRGDGCKLLQVGETYYNFELERKVSLPEYNIDALEFKHLKTKAKYFHLDAKDSNNVFSVMFRTPPDNSNGVPHILEHTVLCGSEKYPVRDPFFNMLKRSLNTYMNALTAYDHTMYPFATTNAKDWENLRSVYCDAVFFPKLEELDFLQEGHRLEIDPNTSELIIKGVVFNEMKGVMSDCNNLFGTKLQSALLKGTIYGHVSGGDPAVIPTLTYEQLKKFHQKYYHPSNSCFYSYGDLPITEHLKYLDQEILSRFQYAPESAATKVSTTAPDFSIFQSSGDKSNDLLVYSGPLSNHSSEQTSRDNNIKYCISKFLDISSTDAFEAFVMRIVSYLLTNGPSSPLYQKLISQKKLGTDFVVGTGFDTSTYFATFGIGLEGLDLANQSETLEAIETAVQETYQDVVDNGFDPERVQALIHQMELSQKQMKTRFGISLLHSISSVWAHEGDMCENLALNPLLDKLNSNLKYDPKFLSSYVEKYLLNNKNATNMTKQVKVLMKPSETYVSEVKALEAERLKAIRATLTKDDEEQIKLSSKKLNEHQAKEQPVDCLPSLHISTDVPRVQPESNVNNFHTVISPEGIPVEFVDVPTTNEITYIRVLFDTSSHKGIIPEKYHGYLPLLTTVLGALGTSRYTYETLPTVIQSVSGGISATVSTSSSLYNPALESHQSVILTTMCLPHKLEATLNLMSELLIDTQFESPENLSHLRVLLQMAAASASDSISRSGGNLAGIRASINLTDSAKYSEVYSGLSMIQEIQKWAHASDEELVNLSKALQLVCSKVFTRERMRLSVVTENKIQSQVEQALSKNFLSKIPAKCSALSSILPVSTLNVPKDSFKSFYGFPIAVNFVVETLPSVSFTHQEHVPRTLLGQMMASCVVHQLVRETGGAYGSDASQGEGSFSFMSHYDPNLFSTLQAYDEAKKWAMNGQFNYRDMEEALLSVFSNIDAPIAPSMKGQLQFIRGITNEMRQQRREQYLDLLSEAGRNELIETAHKAFGNLDMKSNIVVVGSETAREEFEKELKEKGFQIHQGVDKTQ